MTQTPNNESHGRQLTPEQAARKSLFQKHALFITGLMVGNRVEHFQFGTGTIRELRGGGPTGDVVVVDFDNGERKTLSIEHAALIEPGSVTP